MGQTYTKKIRRIIGSCKVEIADLGSDIWYDLGPGEGAQVTENLSLDEYQPENAPSYGKTLLDQTDTVDFVAVEPDMIVFAKARGGIDTVTPVAGTLVSGHTQTIASGNWAFETFIPFDLQNADKSKPTMDSTSPCVAGTDGTLTEGTDFYVVQSGGVWGVIIHDSTKVTTVSQSLVMTYSVTPAASYISTTGGADTINFIQLRLTNRNSAKKEFLVQYYKAQYSKGYQLKFESDKKAATPLKWSLQFTCYRDEDRNGTITDQLRKMKFEV